MKKQINKKLNITIDKVVDKPKKISKINDISRHFKSIFKILGIDLTNPNLIDTPNRIAKMYVEELFVGMNPATFPKITLFDNISHYNEMVIHNKINMNSICAHHFMPFTGLVSIAYIPNKKIIGLSKLNRIVYYFSKRPQIQENLTIEIGRSLQKLVETEDVAVQINAKHFCIISRGIEDHGSETNTFFFEGKFKDKQYKNQFINSNYDHE